MLMQERIKNYKRPQNSGIKTVPYYQKEITYKGNVHNFYAKKFYEKRGAKVLEFSFENNKTKGGELMRTKHCLKYAINKCKSPDKFFLEDESGKKYSLEFDCKNCEMIIRK